MKKEHSFLPGFLALMEAILKQPIPPISPCPQCGTTAADISKFGCANCYYHFNDCQLNFEHTLSSDIIARSQMGNNKHIGKIPKKWQEDQKKIQEQKEATLDKEERIKNFELKMAKAIKVENYEVAGILKKKIEELNSKQ